MPPDDFGPTTYGDRIAGVYDGMYGPAWDPAHIAQVGDTLASLAGPGPALELGIGTGRIALPLAQRGIEVHGIDASQPMVDRLRAKPGGDAIPVTLGSFAGFDLPQRFRLIYVVFNTFFGLGTQEEQVQCMQAVARHLQPGGAFLLEAFVPDPARFLGSQSVRVTEIRVDGVHLDATQLDPATQRVTSQHVHIDGGSIRLYPIQLRYAWPSELDLMARLAGLRLRHRWGNWNEEPFGPASTKHVSVYEPA